jgi:UDP-glucose-4-epimerase GalE
VRLVVTGGAGYIGSHVVRALARDGHEVHVLDDLSSGHAEAIAGSRLERGDVTAPGTLLALARAVKPEAILHFAGRLQVGESMARPELYYAANVGGMTRVCETARELGCGVVFSSTAAVYGEPETIPIPVDHPCRPENPYGRSKWMAEQMLADCGRAGGFRSVTLRYFNAAGGDPAAGHGERHSPETHLVPLAIDAARGGHPPLSLFGDDWPTPDGTCVRDYVHVLDLADAHLRATDHLARGGASATLNLGGGAGHSVRAVLDAVGRAIGRPVPVERCARRPGDVASLVADIRTARELLGWSPSRSQIDQIVADAVAVR